MYRDFNTYVLTVILSNGECCFVHLLDNYLHKCLKSNNNNRALRMFIMQAFHLISFAHQGLAFDWQPNQGTAPAAAFSVKFLTDFSVEISSRLPRLQLENGFLCTRLYPQTTLLVKAGWMCFVFSWVHGMRNRRYLPTREHRRLPPA